MLFNCLQLHRWWWRMQKRSILLLKEMDKSNVDLRFSLKEAHYALNCVMEHVSLVYNVPFKRLLETWSTPSGDTIFKGVEALICDPLYNRCWLPERSSLEHDQWAPQDMTNFLKVVSKLMRVGGHGQQVSSAQQFKIWYEQLVNGIKHMLEQEDCAGMRRWEFREQLFSNWNQKCSYASKLWTSTRATCRWGL